MRKSIIITTIYIIFGCLWILTSDSLVNIMIPDQSNLVIVNTLKGLVYVALTAALIYGLVYPSLKKNIAAQKNLQETINKQKEIERTLFENERSKSVLLENIPGMVYRRQFDREWTILYASSGCQTLTGYAPASIINNNELSFNDLIVPKYREQIWEKWTQILEEGTGYTDEYEIITAGGAQKWVWEQGQGIRDDDGNVIAIEGLILDIAMRKEQESRLTYLNEHNVITGVFNKSKCQEIMTLFFNYDEKQRALLLIDFKKFNLLNITLGYQYSEELIKNISQKLHEFINNHHFMFHISTCQFAFFITDYEGQSELISLSETILKSLEELLAPNNITCNIGIVEIDDIKIEPNDILKRASIAAEHVDLNRLNHYHVFSKEMEERIRRQEAIKGELSECSRGKKDQRLFLEYQPIINAANGSIQRFEALARFMSTEYGLISPLEFIPLAEETQLIVPLGKKIMREAFGFLKHLIDEGFDEIVMSVNVSAIQLLRDDFLPDMIAIIFETGVSPNNINIEITESYFSDNYVDINERLGSIRCMGIAVALDDFGIGYSTFARESELNVDCLKIDKYFIDKLLLPGQNETITSDIISMAHKLGHYVIAEGIEEELQRQYLLEHDCDYMQGFLFSKPVSPEKAFNLLQSGSIILNESNSGNDKAVAY